MQETFSILCNIINQLHAIESKVKEVKEPLKLERKFERIKKHLQELNLFVHNPLQEAYDETRMDCDASIAGDQTENLYIIEVIKPIIYMRDGDVNQIIQRGVVIVEGK